MRASVSSPTTSSVRKVAEVGRPTSGPVNASISAMEYAPSSHVCMLCINSNMPTRLPTKPGVSFATTTPFPRFNLPNLTIRCTTSDPVSSPGITSRRRRYRGGLKKCVPRKRRLNPSDRPSDICPIEIPLVLVEITASALAAASTRDMISCLTSSSSTTASMTQSAVAIRSRWSSRLPSWTRRAVRLVKKGLGRSPRARSNAPSTTLLRFPSEPAMSSSSTRTPALARCAAICAPITPAPSTAAFRIGFILKSSVSGTSEVTCDCVGAAATWNQASSFSYGSSPTSSCRRRSSGLSSLTTSA